MVPNNRVADQYQSMDHLVPGKRNVCSNSDYFRLIYFLTQNLLVRSDTISNVLLNYLISIRSNSQQGL